MAIRVEWTDEMTKSLEKAKVDAQEFVSEFLQEFNKEIVVTTPVRFGFLRGSWFAGLNESPTGVGSRDPSGANVAQLNAVAAQYTLGDTYYLVNTAAYAARVEYGFFGEDSLGRHYSQAGRGWVRAVAARAEQIAAAVAARLGGGR